MANVVQTVDEEDLHVQINNIISHAADAALLRGDGLFRIGVSGKKKKEIMSHVCIAAQTYSAIFLLPEYNRR